MGSVSYIKVGPPWLKKYAGYGNLAEVADEVAAETAAEVAASLDAVSTPVVAIAFKLGIKYVEMIAVMIATATRSTKYFINTLWPNGFIWKITAFALTQKVVILEIG